jgi:signal transduction histidine kinase
VEIILISDDGDLWRLCREVLVEAKRSSWTLSAHPFCANPSYVSSPCADEPANGFCIWDFNPAKSLPTWLDRDPAKHLFLVSGEELAEFRKASQGAAVNILLKPVTRAILAAFLDAALTACPGDTANQKPDSAECFLQTSLRLQKHNHERSEFIARIAHDLRTPATALLGYSGLLLDEGQGRLDEDQKTILRYMHHSADRLARMVSGIFELSVEHLRVRDLHFERGEIPGCLGQALHETALLTLDKRIAIETRTEPFAGELYFDRGLIERVLVNVLENACRFTPLNGRIQIHGYPFFWERRSANVSMPTVAESRTSLRKAPNSYRMDIGNSGDAIPSDQLEHIFEQYIASAPSREHSGSGLGLAICRTIVGRHHGRIWAENTAAGPTVSFVLPGGRPQPAEQPFAEPRLADAPTKTAAAAVNLVPANTFSLNPLVNCDAAL